MRYFLIVMLLAFVGVANAYELDDSKIGIGAWEVSTKLDPIDDSESVVAILESSSKNDYEHAYVIARCRKNKTEVYITWNEYIGSSYTLVITRVDKLKAKESNWGISTDGTATFHNHPIPFLKRLMKGEELIARVMPFGEGYLTMKWSIIGTSKALSSLRERCNW